MIMQELISKMIAIDCDNSEPRLYSRDYYIPNLSLSFSLSLSWGATHLDILCTFLPVVPPLLLPILISMVLSIAIISGTDSGKLSVHVHVMICWPRDPYWYQNFLTIDFAEWHSEIKVVDVLQELEGSPW